MDILQYLLELLKVHRLIGVNGLGTFVKKKTPGRYDTTSHSFVPPSYTIDFDSDLLENGLLQNHIQEKRGISEGAAHYFIDQFVDSLKQELSQSDKVYLEGLGTLTNENGSYVFTAADNVNLGFDFFALPNLVIPEQSLEVSSQEELHSDTENSTPINPTDEELAEPAIATPDNESEALPTQSQYEALPPTEEELFETEAIAQVEVEQSQLTDNDDEASSTQETVEQESSPETEHVSNLEEAISAVDEKEPIIEVQATAETLLEEKNVIQPTLQPESHSASTQTVLSTPAENKEFEIQSTLHNWDFGDKLEPKVNFEEEAIDGTDDQEHEEQVKRGMPLYQKISLFLLVVAMLLAAAYYFEPQVFENFGRKKSTDNEKMVIPVTPPVLKDQTDSLSFADSIMQHAQKAGLEVEPAKDTLKISSSTKKIEEIVTYEIIAAAFAKESEAQEYISYMKKKGFEAKVANMPGKLFKKISIASYNNLDSAQSNLTRLRKQFKNDKIYIQKVKNN